MSKSQNKFVVGDKVVRTRPYNFLYVDGGFMQEGKVYTITGYADDGDLVVEGCGAAYSPDAFQLVQPAFKAMKFKVASPEQSREVQEALFSMGYGWKSYGNKVMFTESYITHNWLYTDCDGSIWLGNDDNRGVKLAEEFTIKTTKSYELIPVEIPKEELVELMDRSILRKSWKMLCVI